MSGVFPCDGLRKVPRGVQGYPGVQGSGVKVQGPTAKGVCALPCEGPGKVPEGLSPTEVRRHGCEESPADRICHVAVSRGEGKLLMDDVLYNLYTIFVSIPHTQAIARILQLTILYSFYLLLYYTHFFNILLFNYL